MSASHFLSRITSAPEAQPLELQPCEPEFNIFCEAFTFEDLAVFPSFVENKTASSLEEESANEPYTSGNVFSSAFSFESDALYSTWSSGLEEAAAFEPEPLPEARALPETRALPEALPEALPSALPGAPPQALPSASPKCPIVESAARSNKEEVLHLLPPPTMAAAEPPLHPLVRTEPYVPIPPAPFAAPAATQPPTRKRKRAAGSNGAGSNATPRRSALPALSGSYLAGALAADPTYLIRMVGTPQATPPAPRREGEGEGSKRRRRGAHTNNSTTSTSSSSTSRSQAATAAAAAAAVAAAAADDDDDDDVIFEKYVSPAQSFVHGPGLISGSKPASSPAKAPVPDFSGVPPAPPETGRQLRQDEEEEEQQAQPPPRTIDFYCPPAIISSSSSPCGWALPGVDQHSSSAACWWI